MRRTRVNEIYPCQPRPQPAKPPFPPEIFHTVYYTSGYGFPTSRRIKMYCSTMADWERYLSAPDKFYQEFLSK